MVWCWKRYICFLSFLVAVGIAGCHPSEPQDGSSPPTKTPSPPAGQITETPCPAPSGCGEATCTPDANGEGCQEEIGDDSATPATPLDDNSTPSASNSTPSPEDAPPSSGDPTLAPADMTTSPEGPTPFLESPTPWPVDPTPGSLEPSPQPGEDGPQPGEDGPQAGDETPQEAQTCVVSVRPCNGPCDEDNDGDGYTESECDCDDMDGEIFPQNPRADVPDDIDNDCNGQDGEDCGYRSAGSFTVFWPEDYDNDGDGYSEDQCDCHDDNSSAYPGSLEPDVLDGIDQDCDGQDGEDEGAEWPEPTPLLGDGEVTSLCPVFETLPCFGSCDQDDDGDGYTEEGCDCNDHNPYVNPGAQEEAVMDGLDEDCDGLDVVDEELPPTDPENHHPPTMPVVRILPENPTHVDDLTCTLERESTDLDGDTIVYTYAWTRNDSEVSISEPTVSHDMTRPGQRWQCTVTPSDGFHLGMPGEDAVTIERYYYLEMKYIEAGPFVMGAASDDVCRYSFESNHNVTLTHDYLMGVTPVTQLQFFSLMGYNPSVYQGCDTCPVETVTWHQAAEFANAVSMAEGFTPCYTCSEGAEVYCDPPEDIYTCQGYRMPTEAEWEYAARSGETAWFSNGGYFASWDQCDDCVDRVELDNGTYLDEVAWYCGDSSEPMPVGQLEPNAAGIYDLHGNIWEWCQDWWDGTSDYSGDAVDPTGEWIALYKAARGGSWTSPPGHNQFPYRAHFPPTTGFENRGFRLMRLALATETPPPESTPEPTPEPSETPTPTESTPEPTPEPSETPTPTEVPTQVP